MKALVIDDEESMRDLVEFILEDFHIEIKKAQNCKIGLDLIESGEKFDFALVDWKTPEMTGLEFVKKIKPNHPEMILIMVTGLSEMSDVEQALLSGCNDYLMKPFDKDMLIDKLRICGLNF